MEMADGNPEWAIGFQDECWWSRVALPTLSSFSEKGQPHRMIQRSVAENDPEPKAISCYGLYLPRIGGEMWLRFVDGRPVSGVTRRFLSWCAEELEAAGKKVLLLIWENASWHISREAMARKTQPGGQEQRLWGEDRELPSSEAESVAERFRGQVGSRQAQGS